MNDSERQVFEESLCDCFAMYEALPKDLNVWWTACHRYELQDVRAALVAHIEEPEGKYAPRPADIIRAIANRPRSDGHIPAAEAWAIAIQAMDEDETVVWTQEIAESWGCAKMIIEAGDEVGARHAFVSAYDRRLAESRANGLRPKWFPSLGHDPDKRASALEAAADRLRLPHLAELEDQRRQPPSPEVEALIAQACRTMRMQAPRPSSEVPLDEEVAALPLDRDARRKALAEMTPSMERRVRHVLGEAEKKRQLEALHSVMASEGQARAQG